MSAMKPKESSWNMESNHQRVERFASEWLTRRDSDAWSTEDQTLLDQWLEEAPANAVAFIRLEAAWARADRYRALGAGFPPRRVPTPEQVNRSPFFNEPVASSAHSQPSALQRLIDEPQSRHRELRRPVSLAVAASLLIAATLGIIGHLRPSHRTYSTQVGVITSIPLQDGSRVTLNTDSEAEVALTNTERRVQLDRGEAFFEVAKDAQRPFVVEAGTKRIVVIGTEFSVRRDGEHVRVAVTQGQVRVEDTALNPSRNAPLKGQEAFVLNAGSVARGGGQGVLVQSKPLSDVLDTVSWRSGFVVFRDVDLAEAVAEFNRYNEKKIVIEAPALAAIRLSGKFKATNFDAFVRLLEEGYPIEARSTTAGIVLVERGR
jgi:transmembrane sensor